MSNHRRIFMLLTGTSGDPAHDGAQHHYNVAEEFGPHFGEVELKSFTTDANDDWPENTSYLYELPDGGLFEDAEGRLLNKVGYGPVQGSIEVVDDDELHAYFDVTTRVRPNPTEDR